MISHGGDGIHPIDQFMVSHEKVLCHHADGTILQKKLPHFFVGLRGQNLPKFSFHGQGVPLHGMFLDVFRQRPKDFFIGFPVDALKILRCTFDFSQKGFVHLIAHHRLRQHFFQIVPQKNGLTIVVALGQYKLGSVHFGKLHHFRDLGLTCLRSLCVNGFLGELLLQQLKNRWNPPGGDCGHSKQTQTDCRCQNQSSGTAQGNPPLGRSGFLRNFQVTLVDGAECVPQLFFLHTAIPSCSRRQRSCCRRRLSR